MSVILFHAGLTQFSGGFVGVDVFFVISGFLITTILIKDQERGGISISKFYQRRAKRIMPVLFVVILATLPVTWMFLPPPELKSYFSSIAATATFSSNILFWYESGYWDTATSLKPLIHTWSLAVEEQYYIVFPLLVMAAWRLGRAWFTAIILALVAASLWFAEHYLATDPMMSFYMLPSRAWELLVGSLAALYLLRRTAPISSGPLNQALSLSGLSMIICAIFTYTEQTPFPGINAALPVIGTALIIAATGSRTMVGMILGSRPFVLIGLISYSAYLWHQPILAVFKLRGFGEISTTGSILAIALTLSLSVLSYRFVEKPVRTGATVFGRRPLTSTTIVILIFSGLGWYGYKSNGFPNRLDDIYPEAARKIERENVQKYTVDSDPVSDKPVILVIGDSYLTNWAIAINEIVDKSKYRIVSVSYLGCDFPDPKNPFITSTRKAQNNKNCADFAEKLAKPGVLEKVKKIFFTSYRPFSYRQNMHRFKLLRQINERVKAELYIFGNYFQRDGEKYQTCMAAMFIAKKDAAICKDIAVYSGSEPEGKFSSYFQLKYTYVDVKDLHCGADTKSCAYQYRGVPFILDANHLTATFATFLLKDAIAKHPDYFESIGLGDVLLHQDRMSHAN